MAKPKAVEAEYGKKSIKVTLYFWTDNLGGEGKILPKHAWDSGMVYVGANKEHRISKTKNVRFPSLPQIGESVKKAVMEAGVILHPSPRGVRSNKSKSN
jgi:hypothetical protein